MAIPWRPRQVRRKKAETATAVYRAMKMVFEKDFPAMLTEMI